VELGRQVVALGGCGGSPGTVALVSFLLQDECLEQAALGYGAFPATGQGLGVGAAVEGSRVPVLALCQGSPGAVSVAPMWRIIPAWGNMNVEQVDLQSEEDRRPKSFLRASSGRMVRVDWLVGGLVCGRASWPQ